MSLHLTQWQRHFIFSLSCISLIFHDFRLASQTPIVILNPYGNGWSWLSVWLDLESPRRHSSNVSTKVFSERMNWGGETCPQTECLLKGSSVPRGQEKAVFSTAFSCWGASIVGAATLHWHQPPASSAFHCEVSTDDSPRSFRRSVPHTLVLLR